MLLVAQHGEPAQAWHHVRSGGTSAAGVVTISDGKVFGAPATGGAPADGQRIILTPQAAATRTR